MEPVVTELLLCLEPRWGADRSSNRAGETEPVPAPLTGPAGGGMGAETETQAEGSPHWWPCENVLLSYASTLRQSWNTLLTSTLLIFSTISVVDWVQLYSGTSLQRSPLGLGQSAVNSEVTVLAEQLSQGGYNAINGEVVVLPRWSLSKVRLRLVINFKNFRTHSNWAFVMCNRN